MEYETVIGLEVHAQLPTKSKMYCRCSADYASAPPNTHVCPVCLGMPGVLPAINQQAVEYTMMTPGPELHDPGLHQVRPQELPLPGPDEGLPDFPVRPAASASRAGSTIEVDGEEQAHRHHPRPPGRGCRQAAPPRTRTAGAYSLVDVNRSGVPLMEIVGEPDLRSPGRSPPVPDEAAHHPAVPGRFAPATWKKAASAATPTSASAPTAHREFGAKVEVKNMNSFRAVFRALEYEAKRQREVAGDGRADRAGDPRLGG